MASTTDFLEALRGLPGLEVDTALPNLGGQAGLYRKLLEQFLRQTPGHLAEMAEAGLTGFALKAHGLKGSLRQMGCHVLSAQAAQLETAARCGDLNTVQLQFGPFREALLRLHAGVDRVLAETADVATPVQGDIREFAGLLAQAKEAASAFDALAASELVETLVEHRFDPETDALLAQAADALAGFQCPAALGFLEKIVV